MTGYAPYRKKWHWYSKLQDRSGPAEEPAIGEPARIIDRTGKMVDVEQKAR